VAIESWSQGLWVFAPLFLIAFAAGALRVMGQRQGDPRRRRLYQALWVALLLAAPPLWLLVAAALKLI
jgi:hypothetical protein